MFLTGLSKKPDIYERLARAIAPSIYEKEDVKKGILLQLFGGNRKDFSKSELNILLCVLQTRAVVLADNGVCCTDELDKMNDSTRSVLHDVMEQQTLYIAKAGIICQLNTRTSILAAANLINSKWDPKSTITENIQLPPTLMSRFDLVFLIILDPQDEQYYRDQSQAEEDSFSMTVLRDNLKYAKQTYKPVLSDGAGQILIQNYVEMRKITAYPRQLESLICLSEAHARMRFSNTVEIVDVEEAARLHREALKQSATDPTTGRIDVSILTTGMVSFNF